MLASLQAGGQSERNRLATAGYVHFFKKYLPMTMKKQTKTERVFEANQPDDFSHRLGRAIAWACDMRLTQIGMPLGDFEIAMDEGAAFAWKSEIKVVEATSPGNESHEKPPSETFKKRLKGGLVEIKKLLTTNWGEPEEERNALLAKF